MSGYHGSLGSCMIWPGPDLRPPDAVPSSLHMRAGASKRSGDPNASLDHIPSDSTGGLTASQEGMCSPIVQDEIVDAVQEARSKLANLVSGRSMERVPGTVRGSLASYDQSHSRWVLLQLRLPCRVAHALTEKSQLLEKRKAAAARSLAELLILLPFVQASGADGVPKSAAWLLGDRPQLRHYRRAHCNWRLC